MHILVTRLAAALLLTALWAGTTAQAGVVREETSFFGRNFGWLTGPGCDTPAINRDADINVVVLPYTHLGGRKQEESVDGYGALPELLGKIIGAGSIAAQTSVAVQSFKSGDCNPEEIYRQLTGAPPTAPPGNAEGAARPPVKAANSIRVDRGLILIWGQLHLEGDDILLQTKLRFGRRYGENRSDLGEGSILTIDDVQYRARLLAQSVTFMPNRFGATELKELAGVVADVDRILQDCAVGTQWSPSDATAAPLKVARCSDNQLRAFRDDEFADAVDRVGRMLPEMFFVSGLVAYLEYRQLGELRALSSSGWQRQQALGRLYRGFGTYIERASRREDTPKDSVPLAFANMIQGYAQYLALSEAGGTDARLRDDMFAHYERAIGYLPFNAELSNMHALATLYVTGGAKSSIGKRKVDPGTELWRAVLLAPGNLDGLYNLNAYYTRHAQQAPWTKQTQQWREVAGKVDDWIQALEARKIAKTSPAKADASE